MTLCVMMLSNFPHLLNQTLFQMVRQMGCGNAILQCTHGVWHEMALHSVVVLQNTSINHCRAHKTSFTVSNDLYRNSNVDIQYRYKQSP